MGLLRHVVFGVLCVFAVGVAAFAVDASGSIRTAGAAGECTTTDVLEADEQAFLTLINDYRVQNGRAPLRVSYTLSKAAQWKSNDMGVNAYFAHDDLNRTWVQRIRDCGYGYGTALGENIAAGYGSAQAVFDGWRNSPGHNSNMLSTGYTAIGIGKAVVAGSPYGTYWSTEFGGYDDGWSVITEPAPTVEPASVAIDTTVRGRTLRITSVAPGATSVEFYLDGALVSKDGTTPFTARTTLRGRESHTLVSRAYWSDGRSTEATTTVQAR